MFDDRSEKDLTEKLQRQIRGNQRKFTYTCHNARSQGRILARYLRMSKDVGEGTMKLGEWLMKAEKFFPKTVQTFHNWFGEIVGYFEQGTTQGIVEGINNRLKVIKRCGFGFTNFANFEKRALLFWHLVDSLA